MGKAITESTFNVVKTLLGAGLGSKAVADAAQTSTATVALIGKASDFEDYKKIRDAQIEKAFAKPVQVSTDNGELVKAIDRVGSMLAQLNENVAALVDAWNKKPNND